MKIMMKNKPYSKRIKHYFTKKRCLDSDAAIRLTMAWSTDIDSDEYCLIYSVLDDCGLLVETHDTESDVTSAIARHINFQNKIRYVFRKGRHMHYSVEIDVFD